MHGLVGWVSGIVIGITRIARLDDEVPAVSVKSGAVDHVLTVGIQTIPLLSEHVFTRPSVSVGDRDLPPMFVPPVMLVRQARGQGRQARGPQAPVRRIQ